MQLSDKKQRAKFRRRLLAWYDRQRRDLPWRQARDPYRVWVSEIMLQQTRVAAVVDYYERFLLRFPSIEKLAAARESAVLAAWSGLGYYRRARMLHAAAKKMVREHGGRIPSRVEELQSLPGIGRYTAAAIASIAFGEPVPVVDGNVERVVQRVLGRSLPREQVWQAAEELLSLARPGDFNQAMMELGAIVCRSRQPDCQACPVFAWCATRGEHRSARREVRRKREIGYALGLRNGSVLLARRPRTASLMPGMWELPELPSLSAVNSAKPGDAVLSLRHSITDTDYVVRVVRGADQVEGRWIPRGRLAGLPLTGLTKKILRAAKVI